MNNLKKMSGSYIMPPEGIRTEFAYSLRNPASLRTAKGADARTDKLISALLTKLSVETEYGKMSGYFRMKYFPVYMIARTCFRYPITGDELLNAPYDCLRKAGNAYYLRLSKRIRVSDSERKGRKKEPDFVDGAYAWMWYPIAEDVAEAVNSYRKDVRLPEDRWLFDWSVPGSSTEARLKMLVDRCNMYVDEFVKGSKLEQIVLGTYGVSETAKFDSDKRRPLRIVTQIAKESAAIVNCGMTASPEFERYVYGPEVGFFSAEDDLFSESESEESKPVSRKPMKAEALPRAKQEAATA